MEDYRIARLSRRERQIMNIVYERGSASVSPMCSQTYQTRPVIPRFVRSVANFRGKGASFPRERWASLHLLSHATAPSGRTFCT